MNCQIKAIAISTGWDERDTIRLTLSIPEIPATDETQPEDVVVYFRVPAGMGREWWQSHLPDLQATFLYQD